MTGNLRVLQSRFVTAFFLDDSHPGIKQTIVTYNKIAHTGSVTYKVSSSGVANLVKNKTAKCFET